MASVELEDISKTYGAVDVIRNLNLSVEDGSFTVFVGPSGCGKSTLLRMIAGLEEITDGELRIDGHRSNDANPIERGVAMVFQNYALYPHMTVAQNIGFSLRMAGLNKAEIAERVAAAAKSLKIEALLDRRPAQLSGGQRQRVAIGRAIVRDPDVFLFDEPLSNLDAELRVSMRLEIAKLHQRLQSTMIYVTHDQTEAMTLADKIVVLRDGKVEQVGPPQELYENPANTFVAGFIGSPRMNFIPAQLRDGTASIPASNYKLSLTAEDQDVTVGIRPEHFRVGDAKAPFKFKADVVENLGGTRFLYGNLEDGTPLVVEARELPTAKAGDHVPLDFFPGRPLFFAADGQRLQVN